MLVSPVKSIIDDFTEDPFLSKYGDACQFCNTIIANDTSWTKSTVQMIEDL